MPKKEDNPNSRRKYGVDGDKNTIRGKIAAKAKAKAAAAAAALGLSPEEYKAALEEQLNQDNQAKKEAEALGLSPEEYKAALEKQASQDKTNSKSNKIEKRDLLERYQENYGEIASKDKEIFRKSLRHLESRASKEGQGLGEYLDRRDKDYGFTSDDKLENRADILKLIFDYTKELNSPERKVKVSMKQLAEKIRDNKHKNPEVGNLAASYESGEQGTDNNELQEAQNFGMTLKEYREALKNTNKINTPTTPGVPKAAAMPPVRQDDKVSVYTKKSPTTKRTEIESDSKKPSINRDIILKNSRTKSELLPVHENKSKNLMDIDETSGHEALESLEDIASSYKERMKLLRGLESKLDPLDMSFKYFIGLETGFQQDIFLAGSTGLSSSRDFGYKDRKSAIHNLTYKAHNRGEDLFQYMQKKAQEYTKKYGRNFCMTDVTRIELAVVKEYNNRRVKNVKTGDIRKEILDNSELLDEILQSKESYGQHIDQFDTKSRIPSVIPGSEVSNTGNAGPPTGESPFIGVAPNALKKAIQSGNTAMGRDNPHLAQVPKHGRSGTVKHVDQKKGDVPRGLYTIKEGGSFSSSVSSDSSVDSSRNGR